ncbi:MAG: 50S ribosomal protein L18 [Planctomycetota bacterium]
MIESKREKRHRHILKKINIGFNTTPRMIIHKSNKNVYLSIVDDINGKVITGIRKSIKNSEEAGNAIAEKAKKLGIEKVFFDRAGYKYHGVVKIVADSARKSGLKF